jgi:carbon monoxide dehydrogenase subunit G
MAERHSCTVAGTPDDVFAFITDQSHLPEWNEAIVSSKVVDPPLREGATIAQVRRRGSKQTTEHFEVAEHDPPRRHRVRGEVSGVNVAIGFDLEPVASGTRVTMGHRARVTGLKRLFGGGIEKALDQASRHAMGALPSAFAARKG